MSRIADINIRIQLDQNNIPEKIDWGATDAGFKGMKPSDALMLSLWDRHERQTFGIDLWTKNMMVEDMALSYFQTFMRLADTYERASKDKNAANLIRKFAQDFGLKLGVIEEVK